MPSPAEGTEGHRSEASTHRQVAITPSPWLRALPAAIVLAAVVALVFHGPVYQYADYHNFADHRGWAGIPNALDVLSNLGFAVVGVYGLWRIWPRRRPAARMIGWPGVVIFLASLVLTALGSAFYHLAPDNTRLIWDRVPIALACAGLLAGVRAQVRHLADDACTALALAVAGIASVLFWYLTGPNGTGDLRPYLLLQASPLVLIPLWQAIYQSPRADRIVFAVAIALYVAAKATELLDHRLFAMLQWISGHTLKHLLATTAAAVIVARLTSQASCNESLERMPARTNPATPPTSLAVNSLCPISRGPATGPAGGWRGLEGGPWLSIYALKPRFQALLRPLTAALAKSGVSANQVTLTAAIVSILIGGFVVFEAPSRWPFLLIPVWLLLRMALNAIDGMLAREFAHKSALGAYLNELGDAISDAALYLPFAWLQPFRPSWIAVVIALAILTELAGVLGQTVGASRRYDGPMGKADRAFAFGALGLWAGLGLPLPEWTGWMAPLMAAALVWTVVNRVRAGLSTRQEASGE